MPVQAPETVQARALSWLCPILACPACRGGLRVGDYGVDPLTCPKCGRSYGWHGPIPVLVEEAPDPDLMRLVHVWNRVAPVWRGNLGKPLKVLEASEVPLLDASSGVVLEIGCGDGRLFAAYEARGLKAIGLDFSVAMLERALEGGFPLVLADAHRVPLADASVDTVLVPFATVRYLDYGVFFAEASRVLKPGGVLGFTAWNALYNGAKDVLRHRASAWKGGRDVLWLRELLGPLRDAGFVLTRIAGVFSAPRWSPLRERVAVRVSGTLAARVARDIVVLARRP